MNDDGIKNPEGSFPPSYALILVGVIPQPRDLEIARLLGWYRIPCRFAPKIVQVDYLAFYQPSTFGKDHSGRIETFTAVHGIELTTRAELIKDDLKHPRANEEYFKIQIGSVQKLKKPIMAGAWKRITFLYTTGELFSSAKTIQDLVVRTDERKVLWHSLRENASKFQEYHQEEIPELAIEPEILMMLGDLQLQNNQTDWCQSI